jgi:hypothetical protein
MRCHLHLSVCRVPYSVCGYMSVPLYRQTVNIIVYVACVSLFENTSLYGDILSDSCLLSLPIGSLK